MIYKHYFLPTLLKEEIKEVIKKEGFDPQLVIDKPKVVYQTHTHQETTCLVCLKGSMELTIKDKCYNFEPGDKVLIEPNVSHSGIVGNKGCECFWSEKLI